MSDPTPDQTPTTPGTAPEVPPQAAPAQPPYTAPAAPPSGAQPVPPAPQYGAPAPQYGAPAAPQYGAPGAPQYGAPAPQYGTPPAPYGTAPYGAAPGYAYPTTPKTNVLAIVSLIASLVGVFLIPFIGQIVGIITGHMSLSQLKTSGEGGRGLALAGTIVGWVTIGLYILLLVFIFVIIGFAAANGARYGYSS